jgi:transcriptional regulator with XRE-family HTH domain
MRKKTDQPISLAECTFIPEGGIIPYNEDPAKLKEWRKTLGLSQVELAKLAGVTRSLLSLIELGERPLVEPSRTAIWNALDNLRNERAKELAAANPTKFNPNDPLSFYSEFFGAKSEVGKIIGLGKATQKKERVQRETISSLKHKLWASQQNEKAAIGRAQWAFDKVAELLDILDLQTKEILAAKEKEEKISALGLEKRSQIAEEVRAEIEEFSKKVKG